MELGLYQKQTMNLVMTTELRQAIALLQYSTIELSKFIQEQATENPLIELEEKSLTIRFEDKYEPAYRKSYRNNDNEESVSPLDFIASNDRGMCEDLLEQAGWLEISDQERKILQYLILNLDDNGYLTLPISEAAEQLSIAESEIENGIGFLQQLEPVGVGARNLKECLLLQAKEYYPDDKLLTIIINDYLDMLANKKWQEISRRLHISLEEIKQVYDCIQTLDPKPCSNFSNASTRYLYPDITIEKINGVYTISMNDNYLPNIHVNQQYMNLLNKENDASKYIKDNYQKYIWLTKSIEQRRSTILKITEVIVDKQREFLENGFAALQPMTLKDVADEIGMHESTVSRATNNKVIRTPNGSYEMRRLFTSKLGKNDGSNASSAKVKLLLKEYIESEDKRKPHSDQKIAEYFKKQNGITISRRTVAKYREELHILSSSKRKTIV